MVQSAAPGPAVVVMAKLPREGEVKTRLAADVGIRRARELADALLADALDMVSGSPLTPYLAYTPAECEVSGRDFSVAGIFPQEKGDLGRRMQRALERLLRQGHYPVLVVGTDCPALSGVDLEAAVIELQTADVVFGPAKDGGYYLLGINGPARWDDCCRLFRGISWGSEKVLSSSLAVAKNLGLTARLLGVKGDLDTIADLQGVYAELAQAKAMHLAPRTREILYSWGIG